MKNKIIDEVLAIELNAYKLGKTGKDIYDRRLARHKTNLYWLIEKL